MAMASSVKAMVIVNSRPMWSEIQPQIGRQIPFSTRSAERANCRAGSVNQIRLIGTLSTLKSTAIGLSWAVAIRPPVATSVIIRYITQNCVGGVQRGARQGPAAQDPAEPGAPPSDIHQRPGPETADHPSLERNQPVLQ